MIVRQAIGRQTSRQGDRQVNRQAGRGTDRLAGRQASRQGDMQTLQHYTISTGRASSQAVHALRERNDSHNYINYI